MSNHHGRCCRAFRRTKARKLRQGKTFNRPIRWKVPQALQPFLSITAGSPNQRMAGFDVFALAVSRYAEHRRKTGEGAPIRSEDDAGI